MERRSSSAPLRLVTPDEAATEARTVAGHAAVFNSESADLGGFVEVIAPGAFARSLSEGRNKLALWNHNSDLPLGSIRSGGLSLSEDEKGLAFSLNADRMTDLMLRTVEAGDAQMSFGFSVKDDAWERRSDGVAVRTLLDVDLFEVSLTVNPAYGATDASFRSLEAFAKDEVRDRAVIPVECESIRSRIVRKYWSRLYPPTA